MRPESSWPVSSRHGAEQGTQRMSGHAGRAISRRPWHSASSSLFEFGLTGYLLLPQVIALDAIAKANDEVDRSWRRHQAPGHVGQHFYWPTAEESPTLYEAGERRRHRRPSERTRFPLNEVGIAFSQTQIALNIPVFRHRPGGPHSDGYAEDRPVPATFSLLAAVLLTDQARENCGNLWVWPGTHRGHAAYFQSGESGCVQRGKGLPTDHLARAGPDPRRSGRCPARALPPRTQHRWQLREQRDAPRALLAPWRRRSPPPGGANALKTSSSSILRCGARATSL